MSNKQDNDGDRDSDKCRPVSGTLVRRSLVESIDPNHGTREISSLVGGLYEPLRQFVLVGLGLGEAHCDDIIHNALRALILPVPVREAFVVDNLNLPCWRLAFFLRKEQAQRNMSLGHLDDAVLCTILEKVLEFDVETSPVRTLKNEGPGSDSVSDNAQGFQELSYVTSNQGKSGQMDALAAYRQDLLRFACRYLSSADAEDFVQQVFLTAISSPMDAIESPLAWLQGVLWYKIAQFFRASKRHKPVPYPDGDVVDVCNSIECDTNASEVLRYLSAVKSPVDRVTLWLSMSQEATHEEIMFVTGAKHVNTVYTRYKRALKQIRAEFLRHRSV